MTFPNARGRQHQGTLRNGTGTGGVRIVMARRQLRVLALAVLAIGVSTGCGVGMTPGERSASTPSSASPTDPAATPADAPAASAAATASTGPLRDLPTAVPESNVGPADTDAWLRRAALDAHSLIPAGNRLVPSMVHYDPGLSVIILRDCSARVQVLLQYIGDDAQAARLSWTDYPSAKSTQLTESERLACGW